MRLEPTPAVVGFAESRAPLCGCVCGAGEARGGGGSRSSQDAGQPPQVLGDGAVESSVCLFSPGSGVSENGTAANLP